MYANFLHTNFDRHIKKTNQLIWKTGLEGHDGGVGGGGEIKFMKFWNLTAQYSFIVRFNNYKLLRTTRVFTNY